MSSTTASRQRQVWEQVSKIQDKLSQAVAAPVAAPQSASSLQLSLENEKLKNRGSKGISIKVSEKGGV